MVVSDRTLVLDGTVVDSFAEWARTAEPRLRHALTASFGSQLGKEATPDALSYAWENWERVSGKKNPLGYVRERRGLGSRFGASPRVAFVLTCASARRGTVSRRLASMWSVWRGRRCRARR